MRLTVKMEPPHVTLDGPDALRFLTAGRATFTVESPSGARFTFRVARPKYARPNGCTHFVAVLAGPENTRDYSHLGTLWPNGEFRARESGTLAGIAFAWAWARLKRGRSLAPAKLYHAGRCGRCGRLLTVPESIRTGLGPECAGRAS